MPRKPRPADDPAAGAKRFEIDGFEVLVGESARDNDRLTFQVARPTDLWLHVAGVPGSHVIVRSEGDDVPRDVVKQAAALAVQHSKAKNARGKVAVHLCRACDVRKPRGAKAGSVELRRYESLNVYPADG